MLSIVIPTLNPGPRFGAVLAALVAGAVEGLVKEVVVADAGSTDRTLELAEEAGCRVVASEKGRGGQLRAGAAAAKADWLLFLHADTVLSPGWVAAVGAHIARNPDKADDAKLIVLYKLLSPSHLLKEPFANDSNSLNKDFYSELLHIIGLEEAQEKNKKVIRQVGHLVTINPNLVQQ